MGGGRVAGKAENTRLEMTADLREKNLHILKSTFMKQQENPADFSSVHKVQAFFAQICCHFTPCISRFRRLAVYAGKKIMIPGMQ